MKEKLKMPLPYISFSAWNLYINDPLGYFQQYFVGRVDKPTLKMKIGKIFQEAWCDQKYDYVAKLRELGVTGDYERVMRTALEHPHTVRIKKSQTERKYTVKGRGLKHPVQAIFDGEQEGLIIENKYGHPWSEKMARESKQLLWYSLVHLIKRGKMPKILLQSFNSRNGIPYQYWIKHTTYEVDILVQEINNVIDKIKAGDFEK